MPIYLHGLSLQFYRGIGPDTQKIGPFSGLNFFIGANNSGKSIILNFISEHLPYKNGKNIDQSTLISSDTYRGEMTGQITTAVAIPKTEFITRADLNFQSNSNFAFIRDKISRIVDVLSEQDMVWVSPNDASGNAYTFADANAAKKIKDTLDYTEWNNLWTNITGTSGGDINQHWIPQSLTGLLRHQNLKIPTTNLIPAIREIGPKDSRLDDLSGKGLIDKLVELQSPGHDRYDDRDIFNNINLFLQEVTGKEQAVIEIPHHREHVLVHMDNKVLPLSSLGTGIQEVIMIAAFCTLRNEEIICIEEPEIHLHPILQRKLVNYLQQYTSNQYFIATHSASFIDTPKAAVFSVSNDGKQTRICKAVSPSEKYEICSDLGIRASDILQTNAVIWVEGPSDRIYVAHWIKALAPEMVEGIHYSIMFYGGRLLSHLTVDSEQIEQFIGLRSLNQNLAIIMDSDKESSHSGINSTKKRIKKEFELGIGVCWITNGREIENYINHNILQMAVKSLYPKLYEKALNGDKYEHALYFHRKTKKPKSDTYVENIIDKVGVARRVCEQDADLGILDLKKQVKALVTMIERANKI